MKGECARFDEITVNVLVGKLDDDFHALGQDLSSQYIGCQRRISAGIVRQAERLDVEESLDSFNELEGVLDALPAMATTGYQFAGDDDYFLALKRIRKTPNNHLLTECRVMMSE